MDIARTCFIERLEGIAVSLDDVFRVVLQVRIADFVANALVEKLVRAWNRQFLNSAAIYNFLEFDEIAEE